MKHSIIGGLALVLLAADGKAQASLHGSSKSWDLSGDYSVREAPDGQRYVSDELLLGLHANAERAKIQEHLLRRGARVVGDLAAWRVLRVKLSRGEDPLRVAASYASIPGVAYAEANDVGEGGGLGGPSDTYFPNQWHHENTGQAGGTPGADIETIGAWALVNSAVPVVLAVLDTGIDFSHPEFMGRVVPGWDYVNEDQDATADHPHGILVAGIAAANTDNGFGIAGVDRTCTIYPIKVLDQNNAGTVMDLVQGLQDCAVNQVDVVSMSLINYGNSQTLENALVFARNAGCILVACAGNGGLGDADVSGPGQSSQTFSIGATTRKDYRASYSGTGAALDFVAPGHKIRTVSIAHTDGVTIFSGCSAATPVAAGLVAMLLGQDPSLTQSEVYDLLREGAEDQVGQSIIDLPGWDEYFGHGRLNAWRSVASMTPCAPPEVYGTGKLTSAGGTPFVQTLGSPRLSRNDFSIEVRDAMPNVSLILFHGPGSLSTPWLGGTLLVAPPIERLQVQTTDPNGGAHYDIPIEPSMVGTQRFYQAWFRDVQHQDGTGVGMSNAVAVSYCP